MQLHLPVEVQMSRFPCVAGVQGGAGLLRVVRARPGLHCAQPRMLIGPCDTTVRGTCPYIITVLRVRLLLPFSQRRPATQLQSEFRFEPSRYIRLESGALAADLA